MNKRDLETKAKAYALKNAITYNGNVNQGAVISGLFNEGLKKDEVKKYIKKISEIVKKVNSLNIDEQKKEFEKLKDVVGERPAREGLPELPNVSKKGVIMRIAPSPSGAMHIGHALTSCISYLYLKKYGGKFYVRIEDTNPDNIYAPAYKLLKKDSKWLFEGNAKIVIQSEGMKTYYKYIEKLINKKAVYVCTCTSEEFSEYVKAKKACPCRNLSVKENKERWERMLAPQAYTQGAQDPDKSSKKISTGGNKKRYEVGEAVLRFIANMQDKNPAMRDFPLARINETSHPLQKKKYRVWPLMNLAVTVDDIEMKMTHIIRAKDHRDNAQRQKMIYKALGVDKKFPWTGFLGRWHIKGFRLSASEITKGVREGKYSGWDDSKLPTLQALKKKGYRPQAFYKFAERVGLTETDKVIDREEFFKLLDNFNKT